VVDGSGLRAARQQPASRETASRLRLPRARRWLAALAVACSAPASSLAADAADVPPLTTAPGSPRLPGKFVWADLVTDDVSAARRFYAQLFGWTFREAGGYSIAANDERPVCGMFQRPRPRDRVAEPRWFAYVSVADVEHAQREVLKAGGRVLAPAREVPRRGEQAVFADPEGAVFGVVESSSGDPEDFLAEPGDWIWIQLLSRDGRGAAEFYRKVAGYEVVENPAADRLGDYLLVSDGYARATVRTISSARPRVQPTWLPFVRVKSVSESVAAAKRLGGSAVLEPRGDLVEGRVAVVADPTGAAIGLLEWSEALPEKGHRP
jgi:predicted enzyme related to lactoylglutathione lyase